MKRILPSLSMLASPVQAAINRSRSLAVAAFAMFAAIVVGGSALAQEAATYTPETWTDGVKFPIDLSVISVTLFTAGALVMVAVYTPGLGFRFVGKAVYALIRFLKV